jgi:hypothetical protein
MKGLALNAILWIFFLVSVSLTGEASERRLYALPGLFFIYFNHILSSLLIFTNEMVRWDIVANLAHHIYLVITAVYLTDRVHYNTFKTTSPINTLEQWMTGFGLAAFLGMSVTLGRRIRRRFC